MAASVLDCLVASGIRFAVLHGESDLADGELPSDMDLVTDSGARDVIEQARPALHRLGLHPVLVCQYDVDAESVFVVDRMARDGAQLDLLHDREGRGHIGLRPGAALRCDEPGIRWRRVAPVDQLLYLVRKRQHKGQGDRLIRLREEIAGLPPDVVHRRIDELFSPLSAEAVRAALSDGSPPATLLPVAHAVTSAPRLLDRIRRPVGFWIEIEGAAAEEAAKLLAERFRRVLPVVRSGTLAPSRRELVDEIAHLVSTRWRPGLYISWGGRIPVLRPDVVISAGDGVDEKITAVAVDAMERRLRL